MSKKESNVPKGGIPNKPGISKMPEERKVSEQDLINGFQKWKEKYQLNPASFNDVIDNDYAETCGSTLWNLIK